MHVINEKFNIIKKEIYIVFFYFCLVLIALKGPFETVQNHSAFAEWTKIDV